MFFSFKSLTCLIIPIFIFLFSKISSPQDDSYLDSLDGKFALQFQINDNFKLSSFQGTTFSGKYHFSNRDAFRLGLSLEFGDAETESELTRLDTVNIDKSRSEIKSFSITIKTQYVHYFTITNDISFFGGIGPFVNFFDWKIDAEINEEGNEMKRESQRNGFSTGMDMLLGVEWWFHKSMSLSAEYGLKFSYSSSEDKIKDDIIDGESTSKSFAITGNHVNFGITIYF